jgi:hypothetical protein
MLAVKKEKEKKNQSNAHNIIEQRAVVMWALRTEPWDAQTLPKETHT